MAAFGVIFMAHMVGGAWIMESWRTVPLSKEPAELRVLQWNVSRTEWSREVIFAQVKSYDADVLAISEPVPTARDGGISPRTAPAKERWQQAFPEYQCHFAGNEMLCMIRGEVTNVRLGTLHAGSPYALYEARVKGRDLRVLQVDIDARPVHPRKPPLTALAKLVEPLNDLPLIVIGDFNTPRDSVYLQPLRKDLKYAWEAAGRGCADTWPSFLPVLSLDQIWSGHGLRPIRCQHGVSFRSDHRPVFAEYQFD
jgi:endonuclease/exonuclease/phosphatase (EEP) superfamily protein YafD